MKSTVVIAGGGLAGAAAACHLARAGCSVTLFERSTGPSDKICGEFLSVEAQYYLARLGLDLASLGAQPIDRLRLIRGGRVIETRLPFKALGLSRFTLDEALLRQAEAGGAALRRGETVESAERIDFLATGKHDLRGVRRLPDVEPELLVGFKTYFRLTPPQQKQLAHTVELMLFPDGYAGLQSVESGKANLCLLVHRDRLLRLGGWDALVTDLCDSCKHLALRLDGAKPLLDRPLSIARVPYGFIHQSEPEERLYRLGDQAHVTPSFTGDGMAMALHSAALAVDHYRAGSTPCLYHRRLAADVAGPIRRAMRLYGLGRSSGAQAWLFAAASFSPGLLRLAARLTRVPEQALARDVMTSSL